MKKSSPVSKDTCPKIFPAEVLGAVFLFDTCKLIFIHGSFRVNLTPQFSLGDRPYLKQKGFFTLSPTAIWPVNSTHSSSPQCGKKP
jgi:hypothetical protein